MVHRKQESEQQINEEVGGMARNGDFHEPSRLTHRPPGANEIHCCLLYSSLCYNSI